MNYKKLVCVVVVLFFGLILNIPIRNNQLSDTQNIRTNNGDFDARNFIGLGDPTLREGLTGDNITVAILDTGIEANHPVFNPLLEDRISFYDWETNSITQNPEDIDWHGTWAASICGGNSLTYKGVAPDIYIIAMKIFFEDNGQISSNISLIEKAVDWIIDNKEKYSIRIASMSFGLEYGTDLKFVKQLNQKVEKLVDNNVFVVASAGNSGNFGYRSIESPASAKSVLAAGGVDYDGNMYIQSSRGPTYEYVIKPDVCAPAVNVYGAVPGITQYSYASGTSAATPFIAGLAALMVEKDLGLNALDIKSLISLTSYRTIQPRIIKDNIQGWGVIQGYAALDALNQPILINSINNYNFRLNQSHPVLCIPIHHNDIAMDFLQLNQQGSAEAEMYLFSQEPDENGNPILLSHTISHFEPFDNLNRIGISNFGEGTYYLVIKLIHETGEGSFSLTFVLEYRLSIFIVISSINAFGLIYIISKYIKFKKIVPKRTI